MIATTAVTTTPLAGSHKQLSSANDAEGVGFEPTRTRERPSGFQDRRHRPLGEPSRAANVRHAARAAQIVACLRATGHCQAFPGDAAAASMDLDGARRPAGGGDDAATRRSAPRPRGRVALLPVSYPQLT